MQQEQRNCSVQLCVLLVYDRVPMLIAIYDERRYTNQKILFDVRMCVIGNGKKSDQKMN